MYLPLAGYDGFNTNSNFTSIREFYVILFRSSVILKAQINNDYHQEPGTKVTIPVSVEFPREV